MKRVMASSQITFYCSDNDNDDNGTLLVVGLNYA